MSSASSDARKRQLAPLGGAKPPTARGVLSVIQSKNWIEPHGLFRDFVESEHGLNYRRAMYWVGIYNGLIEAAVPWEEVKGLGWTNNGGRASVMVASLEGDQTPS